MYCENCGTTISGEANFCGMCGAGLASDTRKDLQQGAATAVQKKHLESIPDQIQTHPWRRFFARNVDLVTGGLTTFFLAMVFLNIVFPDAAEGITRYTENIVIASVTLYLVWLPVEAGFLAGTGTTPGKWVFGISVRERNGQRLTFQKALERTARVWIFGEGGGIPIVSLFTRVAAYNRLKSKRITSWDEDLQTVVLHRPWGPLRAISCGLAVFLSVMVVGMLETLFR